LYEIATEKVKFNTPNQGCQKSERQEILDKNPKVVTGEGNLEAKSVLSQQELLKKAF